MSRKCDQCGGRYPGKQARRESILGLGFFEVLEMRDLGDAQQRDVEHRCRYCCEECADAGKVRKALSPPDHSIQCKRCKGKGTTPSMACDVPCTTCQGTGLTP